MDPKFRNEDLEKMRSLLQKHSPETMTIANVMYTLVRSGLIKLPDDEKSEEPKTE